MQLHTKQKEIEREESVWKGGREIHTYIHTTEPTSDLLDNYHRK